MSGRFTIVKGKEVLIVEEYFNRFTPIVGVGASPCYIVAVEVAYKYVGFGKLPYNIYEILFCEYFTVRNINIAYI